MRAKSAAAVIAVLCLYLLGCSDPKIDTTTDETSKASIQKVRDSLPEEDRAKFEQAVMGLTIGRAMEDAFSGKGTGGNPLASLNGKTGREVIAEAEKLEAEREQKQREQALAEIKELVEKKAQADADRASLAKFQVVRSRFYKEPRSKYSFMEKPVIEMTVRNGTDKAISRAYFLGTVASPGRSVPWIKEDFNYSIKGGLEPGEEQKWNLAPNSFSEWGKTDVPSDAVLTVEVLQLDGADEAPIFSVRSFSERDAERLAKLREKYPN